jgi:4a-hydroxytetrahydrobiopterin dehydratase
MNLSNKKCQPCEGGIPKLKEEEIKELMKLIGPAWKLIDNSKIIKEYSFVNFIHTMKFVNRVAELAEQEGHHPNLFVSYGKCSIELWTHAINGLSDNDFILAAKIDDLI